MAEIAVRQAAFSGFGLLRRKPWVPLVWSTLYALVLGGFVVFIGGAFIIAFGKLMLVKPGAPAPVQEILMLFANIMGGYLALLLVFWILGAVINMAVVRSVMEPEAGAFAYLRFGRAELWLMLANFVLYVLYVMASTVASIPVTIITVIVATTWRQAQPFVVIPLELTTWGVTIWLGLRFCMVPVLIFTEKRFHLFESWAITRGHVWRLFLTGLLMVVAAAGIYLVLAAIGMAVGVPMAIQTFTGVKPEQFFAKSPAEVFRTLSPFIGLYVAVVWLGSIILMPVMFSPWPAAYRQLKGDELTSTFS